MRIAKEFKFEAAHRLQFDDGDCRNLHGHSYRVIVEISGDGNMVMDTREITSHVQPLIDRLDHSTILDQKDPLVRTLRGLNNLKVFVLRGPPTVENIARCFLAEIPIIDTVRVYETATIYAEATKE